MGEANLVFMDFMNILAVGFLFFTITRRILNDSDKKAHFKSFRILSDKEKDYYDIKKIKISEILLMIFVYFFMLLVSLPDQHLLPSKQSFVL